MANTVISLKKSATPSATPIDLANGEIAINYADGILFYKSANGSIASISTGSGAFGTVNANGTLIIADALNDVLDVKPGDFISITGDAINDSITISGDVKTLFDHANQAFDTANNALGSFPVGDYSTGEPVLGQSESFDAFGISLILGFDCNSPGTLKFTDLGSEINI